MSFILTPYIGFGAGSLTTWQQVATDALTNGDSPNWNNYTIVWFYPQASLTVTGGEAIRLTIKAPSATGCTIDKCYIGQADAAYSATSPSFAGTPTQVLFSGSASLSTGTGGATTLSDQATFSIPASNGLIIAVHTTASVWSVPSSAGNSPANWKFSYKSGVDEASTVSKSGYTDFTATHGTGLINKIEVLA